MPRGIGGPKQDAEFDLDAVHSLRLGDAALVQHGPLGPGRLCEFASFFVLREIEASLCLAVSITVAEGTREVTVALSKPLEQQPLEQQSIGWVQRKPLEQQAP